MARITRQTTGKGRRLLRRVVLGGLTISVIALLAMAWSWQQSLPLKKVVVSGNVHSDSAEVALFAAVQGDSTTRLFSLDPELVADRVRRAPWVRDASIRRMPTGTLAIRVEERMPVTLVIDSRGRPSAYLDADGYSMPLVEDTPYDVPLIRGNIPELLPNQPLDNESTLEILSALDRTTIQTDALISEVVLSSDGNVSLRLSPGATHPSIPVDLGKGDYETKLHRLYDFWRQAVLTRPEQDFQVIDLRFDGQIITRESTDSTSQHIPPNPQAP